MAWNALRYACADLAPQSWTLLSQLTPTSADITEKHTASVAALGKGASVLYMFCTHSQSRSRLIHAGFLVLGFIGTRGDRFGENK